MDLSWAPEQRELHDRLRGWPQPGVDAGWKTLADAGVLALPVEQSPLTCAFALEGLGYGCRDLGLLVRAGAHMWAVEVPVLRYGSPEQREAYLAGLAQGRMVGAHAITETESGSDALAMRAVAQRIEGGAGGGAGYVINGRKRFVTNAPDADLFVVYATVNPALGFTGVTAFLVERDNPGLRVEPELRKAGLESCPWGQVVLEDCVVGPEGLLGAEKQGSAIFGTVMAWERALILAPLLGAMERQIEECVERARTRRQFGRRIGSFQAVAHRIVEMQHRLETSRGLVRAAAWELGRSRESQGTRGSREGASFLPELVKLHVSEAAVATFDDALQIFGALGYTEDAGIERRLRDALGTRVSSGTSDMQREVIAGKLGLR